jgi:hypothetical protein
VRFVGFVALAATFWLSVATVRLLILHDDCPYARQAAETRTPTVKPSFPTSSMR